MRRLAYLIIIIIIFIIIIVIFIVFYIIIVFNNKRTISIIVITIMGFPWNENAVEIIVIDDQLSISVYEFIWYGGLLDEPWIL